MIADLVNVSARQRRGATLELMRLSTIVAVFALLVCRGSASAMEIGGVVAARERLTASYANRLAELAVWCAGQNLKAEAAATRAWRVPRQADRLYLWVLPTEGMNDALASQDKRWRDRFAALRREQADALYELVKQAVDEHRSTLAAELLVEVVWENPDHDEARKLLGYVKDGDIWRTPFEVRQVAAEKIWHPKFGWLPQAHAARYEAGERYYRGRWMSASEESRLRSDLRRGWKVETEHYLVTTNHSLEEGVRLASQLERLYGFWQNVFQRYSAGPDDLARRLAGGAAKRMPTKKHNVMQYRSRSEYNDALRKAQPKIEITLGIYFDTTQTAHFFAGKEQETGTIYHEATHQLFQETRPTVRHVGAEQNFWIVEAIACYMESLKEHDGYHTLGGLDEGRLPAARQRLLEDGLYIPLAGLIQLGTADLQSSPDIGMLYSQSSGLAAFFMQYDGGRYRDALVDYLTAVYTGRDKADTLARLCGESTVTLDGQYRRFLELLATRDPGREVSKVRSEKSEVKSQRSRSETLRPALPRPSPLASRP